MLSETHVPERVNFFEKIEHAMRTFQPLPKADEKSHKLFLNRQGMELCFKKGERIHAPRKGCFQRLCCALRWHVPEAERESYFRKVFLWKSFYNISLQKKSLLHNDGTIDQEKVRKLEDWQADYMPFVEQAKDEFDEAYQGCASRWITGISLEPRVNWQQTAEQQRKAFLNKQKKKVQDTEAVILEPFRGYCNIERHKELLKELHAVTKYPSTQKLRTTPEEISSVDYHDHGSFLHRRILQAKITRVLEKCKQNASCSTVARHLFDPVLEELNALLDTLRDTPLEIIDKTKSAEFEKTFTSIKDRIPHIEHVAIQSYEEALLSEDTGVKLFGAAVEGRLVSLGGTGDALSRVETILRKAGYAPYQQSEERKAAS
jgi:hypothetical protein